jgi:hypothetical protein
MSTYPVDVKIKRITSTVANQTIFAGPARILGFSANCTAGAGTIDIENASTSLGIFGTPNGSSAPFVYSVMFPGTGLYCKDSATCSLGTIADVTFFYG